MERIERERQEAARLLALRTGAADTIGAAKRALDARKLTAARRQVKAKRDGAASSLQRRQREKMRVREERRLRRERAATRLQSVRRGGAVREAVAARRIERRAQDAAAAVLQGCVRRKSKWRAVLRAVRDEAARRDAAATRLQRRHRTQVATRAAGVVADDRRRVRAEGNAALAHAQAQTRGATLIQARQRGKAARLACNAKIRASQVVSGGRWARAMPGNGKLKPTSGSDVTSNILLCNALRRSLTLSHEVLARCKIQKGLKADSFLLLEGVWLQPMLEGRAGATKDMSAGKKRRT